MLRWTARIVDACPQFCLRCESRITKIALSQGISTGTILVRCGHCQKLLGRVPYSYLQSEEAPSQSLEEEPHDGPQGIGA